MALSDIERAVYSASMVEVAIQGWSLEHQTTGHPISSMTYPVRDLTDSGFVPSSVPQPLAKSESTYTSTGKVPLSGEGFKINPLLAVPFKYRPMRSRATSWLLLGECIKRETWETAKPISGLE